MSYLTQYALPDTAPRSHRGARVDLELPLNRPEFHERYAAAGPG